MITFKISKFFTTCMIVLTLSGCTNIVKTSSVDSWNDISKIVEDTETKMYEDIVVNFNELSINSIEEALKSSDEESQYYFYFGRTTCSYCRKLIIENAEPLKDLQRFYYINTANFSEDESSIMSEYGIDLIPAILTATSSENIKLTDIKVFIDDINQKSE